MFKWLTKELFHMLPVVLFFFVAFSLVDITHILTHKTTGARCYGFLVIVMASFVMGKVVLISDSLSITDRFANKPLIYNTLWKTLIYVLCSIWVRVLDRVVPGLIEGHSVAVIEQSLVEEVGRLSFWIAQMWLLVLFSVFVAYRELINAVGKDKVRKLFFGAKGKNG